MGIINSAFAEREPSLFIIQTPFQAMCAINAIIQLRIEDYTLALHLHKKTEKRNRQTIELLESNGLKYQVAEEQPISFFDRLSLFFNHRGEYNRVFLGTHLYQNGYYYALKELRDGGNLVLLDDGAATVTLLNGDYKIKGRSRLRMAWNQLIASKCNIKINNILTVYKDIGNPKWNIAFNDISRFRRGETPIVKKFVFFIGTNNSLFIDEFGVDEYVFQQVLCKVLGTVKMQYPLDEIIYIPHGRDRSTLARDYCKDNGIEYKPLDVNVEFFILSLGIVPKAVFGFTSSALYNLKRIYPESSVYNIAMRLLTDKDPGLLVVTDYYEKQGIPAILV